MLFFARDPALRPACALPDLGTVRGPKMLILPRKVLELVTFITAFFVHFRVRRDDRFWTPILLFRLLIARL